MKLATGYKSFSLKIVLKAPYNILVGVKFASQRWAIVLVLSPTTIRRKGTGIGSPSPTMLGRACLGASEEEYLLGLAKWVSDSHPIHGEKSPNTKKFCMTFGEGGNHYCRIKCQGTTFPAALM